VYSSLTNFSFQDLINNFLQLDDALILSHCDSRQACSITKKSKNYRLAVGDFYQANGSRISRNRSILTAT
ncbi:Hypothetical predicted protein, partial [Paramuricea clavata]